MRVRVALEVLDEGASYFLLGPALGRVGDALSEAHRLGLGLKLGGHRFRLQFRASGDGRAAVVETAPWLAFGRSGLRSLAARLRRQKGLDSREPELTLGGPSLNLPDRASARYGREVSSGSRAS